MRVKTDNHDNHHVARHGELHIHTYAHKHTPLSVVQSSHWKQKELVNIPQIYKCIVNWP